MVQPQSNMWLAKSDVLDLVCPTTPTPDLSIIQCDVGAVGQTSSKKSDFASHSFLIGVAPYWVVSVNLMVGRIVKGRHEESEQPNCPTSWD